MNLHGCTCGFPEGTCAKRECECVHRGVLGTEELGGGWQEGQAANFSLFLAASPPATSTGSIQSQDHCPLPFPE